MFLAIQFVGFCNQPYLQNKVSQVMRLRNWLYLKNELMEWTDILHAGANSGKLKSYFNDFWVGMVRNSHVHLGREALKSVVSKEWVY